MGRISFVLLPFDAGGVPLRVATVQTGFDTLCETTNVKIFPNTLPMNELCELNSNNTEEENQMNQNCLVVQQP